MSEAEIHQVEFSGSPPIATVQPRERLGVLIVRYRTAAGLTVGDLAERLGVSESVLADVERHQLTLSAGALQLAAAAMGVRYEPLLDAARDWHRAVWEGNGSSGGVQLESMTTSTRPLGRDREAENALELELIQCSDELVFLSNVLREAAIKAERGAERARELLASRGVEAPGVEPLDGPAEVVCEGPRHEVAATPRKMVRGRDLVIAYQSDGGPDGAHYFCSHRCGQEWAKTQ